MNPRYCPNYPVLFEPISAERRAIRIRSYCSGGFQSATMLRNHKRAVGSVHILLFQIFKGALHTTGHFKKTRLIHF
ncbi:MAG: hypothetical protein RIR11_5043 [Bacteroidota bacterium]